MQTVIEIYTDVTHAFHVTYLPASLAATGNKLQYSTIKIKSYKTLQSLP